MPSKSSERSITRLFQQTSSSIAMALEMRCETKWSAVRCKGTKKWLLTFTAHQNSSQRLLLSSWTSASLRGSSFATRKAIWAILRTAASSILVLSRTQDMMQASLTSSWLQHQLLKGASFQLISMYHSTRRPSLRSKTFTNSPTVSAIFTTTGLVLWKSLLLVSTLTRLQSTTRPLVLPTRPRKTTQSLTSKRQLSVRSLMMRYNHWTRSSISCD